MNKGYKSIDTLMKTKRRKPINFLKYLCISCGLVFLFGNMMLLNDDIYEIYYRSIIGGGNRGVDRGKQSDDHLMGEIQRKIQLPLEAFNHETRLRHLMVQDFRQVYNTAEDTNTSEDQVLKEDRLGNAILLNQDELLQILSITSNCSSTYFNANENSFIAAGWTKAVYKGHMGNNDVAVKTIYDKGFDVTKCLNNKQYFKSSIDTDNIGKCFTVATNKILREIVLLNGLHHPNIVKLKTHCVPDLDITNSQGHNKVFLVTELGDPVDLIKLLQMTWEDRLRITYGLVKLLHYLANSPYGSIILNDLKRQQFVLVNGDIKLSDMDDAGFQEPTCQENSQCTHLFTSSNFTLKTPCYDNQCYQFNEKMNIYNTGRHFTTFLLPYGCPGTLCPIVNSIVEAFKQGTMGPEQLLQRMTSVVKSFSNGDYLNRKPSTRIVTAYSELLHSDLPGLHDYTCDHNMGPVCTLSVYDRYEAEAICDNDPQCSAFVMSEETSWTGRTLAHFKNNFSNPSYNKNTRLYVKPGFVT